MIHYPDFRLVTLPRIMADLLSGPPEPPYKRIRPDVRTVDDALAWLHDQSWKLTDDSDRARRRCVKWLAFLRWSVDAGLDGEGRP